MGPSPAAGPRPQPLFQEAPLIPCPQQGTSETSWLAHGSQPFSGQGPCPSQHPSCTQQGSAHDGGRSQSGCPQVILCSPVQPLRRPGPNSRTLRPRQPWAGQPTCLPRRLAEFTAHRPGSKGARPVILWPGAGADDGPRSGTRLFTVTPSAPGPSTGGSVLLPRVPSSGARDPPCVAGVLPRGQGGQY